MASRAILRHGACVYVCILISSADNTHPHGVTSPPGAWDTGLGAGVGAGDDASACAAGSGAAAATAGAAGSMLPGAAPAAPGRACSACSAWSSRCFMRATAGAPASECSCSAVATSSSSSATSCAPWVGWGGVEGWGRLRDVAVYGHHRRGCEGSASAHILRAPAFGGHPPRCCTCPTSHNTLVISSRECGLQRVGCRGIGRRKGGSPPARGALRHTRRHTSASCAFLASTLVAAAAAGTHFWTCSCNHSSVMHAYQARYKRRWAATSPSQRPILSGARCPAARAIPSRRPQAGQLQHGT